MENNFYMEVDDVFRAATNGCVVVTGKIETGSVKIGSTVDVVSGGFNKSVKKGTVKQILLNNQTFEVVLAGEKVAILLEVDSVKIGDKLRICSE